MLNLQSAGGDGHEIGGGRRISIQQRSSGGGQASAECVDFGLTVMTCGVTMECNCFKRRTFALLPDVRLAARKTEGRQGRG